MSHHRLRRARHRSHPAAPTKSVGLTSDGGPRLLAEGKDDCLVLDFAGNTARHGPIDTVDGRKKEPAGDGEAPIKVCPECQTINHASARHCIECDHEFPPPVVKVAPQAASNALLSTQIQAAWCDVTGITYARHDKPGKPASLRVTYECGLARHSEWVCFEHTGFPRDKAVGWWRRRAGNLPPRRSMGAGAAGPAASSDRDSGAAGGPVHRDRRREVRVRCAACRLRTARGFGWFDPRVRTSEPLPACSMRCMNALCRRWGVVDPDEHEIAAIAAASPMAGEYLESIGKTDSPC